MHLCVNELVCRLFKCFRSVYKNTVYLVTATLYERFILSIWNLSSIYIYQRICVCAWGRTQLHRSFHLVTTIYDKRHGPGARFLLAITTQETCLTKTQYNTIRKQNSHKYTLSNTIVNQPWKQIHNLMQIYAPRLLLVFRIIRVYINYLLNSM